MKWDKSESVQFQENVGLFMCVAWLSISVVLSVVSENTFGLVLSILTWKVPGWLKFPKESFDLTDKVTVWVWPDATSKSVAGVYVASVCSPISVPFSDTSYEIAPSTASQVQVGLKLPVVLFSDVTWGISGAVESYTIVYSLLQSE